MLRNFLLFIIYSLALLSVGLAINYVPYNVELGGLKLSFLYPKGWLISSSSGYLHVYSPNREIIFSFTVLSDPKLRGIKLKSFGSVALSQIKGSIEKLKMESLRDAMIAGKRGVYLQFSGELRGEPIWGFSIWTLEGDKALVVLMLSRIMDRKQLQGVVNTIIGSLKVQGDGFGYQVFRDEKLGIEISYLSSWRISETTSGGVRAVIFVSPKDSSADNFHESLEVRVGRSKYREANSSNLEESLRDYIRGMSASFKDFKVVSEDNVKLGGKVAKQVVFTATLNGRKLKGLQSWTFHNGRIFLVTFLSTPEKFSLYLPIVREMIRSLKFI